MGRHLRGLPWMIWHFGPITTFRYERARRAGATLDYAQVFTADELALLAEHVTMPWEGATREERP